MDSKRAPCTYQANFRPAEGPNVVSMKTSSRMGQVRMAANRGWRQSDNSFRSKMMAQSDSIAQPNKYATEIPKQKFDLRDPIKRISKIQPLQSFTAPHNFELKQTKT